MTPLAFRELARLTEGIDLEVYAACGKDPLDPVIGLGRPEARIAFFGRDPGRDEIRHGEPFVGAGGQHVRRALYLQLHGRPLPDFEASLQVGREFFWANTVPYKPVGNKAWSTKVKQRFHPLMRQLLIDQWQGDRVITLGREAFLWFGIALPKPQRERLEAFWNSETRFEQSFALRLETDDGRGRELHLYPLPHPSPLNATWYARFPALLKARLEQLEVRPGNLLLG
ncbi:MAG TPA: uracil-DNA glycosylase family protein [Solimonas sp.]|nr:uracil-DNA glycosylase family protein [Solimonas sp.]